MVITMKSEDIVRKITPELIKVEAFSVVGLRERTKNIDEFNPQTARLPALWERFHTSQIATQKPNSLIYGVYSDYESDDKGFYTVTFGIEVNDSKTISYGDSVNIKKGNYLIFKNTGPMPKTIIETWQAIWHFFDTQTNISRAYETDFEVYMGQEQCAIYIGVNMS